MNYWVFLDGNPAWNNFLGQLSKILYTLLCALFKIIYYVEKAFYILATGNINGKKDMTVDADNNLVFNIFNFNFGKNANGYQGISNNGIGTMLLVFMAIAICVLFVSVLIVIGRQLLTVNKEFKMQEVIGRVLIAIACIIMFPFAFYMFIYISTYVINLIFYACGISFGNSGEDTLATHLFYTFFDKPKGTDYNSVTDFFVKGLMCENGKPWEVPYAKVNGNVIELDIGQSGCSFHYLLALIVSCILLWAIFSCTIGLAERIINFVLLYIIGTVPIATMVMDNGDRFKNYRGLALSKMFGIIGNMLSMYIFVFIIKLPMLNDIRNNTYGYFEDSMIGLMIYYIFVIGGSMCCAKGSHLIASMISSVAQNEDGWSQAQTQRLLQGGMNLAKGIGIGALSGAIGGSSSTLGKVLSGADGVNNAGGGTGNNTQMVAPSPQSMSDSHSKGNNGFFSKAGTVAKKAGGGIFRTMGDASYRQGGGALAALGAGAGALVAGAYVGAHTLAKKGAVGLGKLGASGFKKAFPSVPAHFEARKQLKQEKNAEKQRKKAEKINASNLKYNDLVGNSRDKQLENQYVSKYSQAYKGLSSIEGTGKKSKRAEQKYMKTDGGALKDYVDQHKKDDLENGSKLGSKGAFVQYYNNKFGDEKNKYTQASVKDEKPQDDASTKYDGNKGGTN